MPGGGRRPSNTKLDMGKIPTRTNDITKFGILMGGIAQVNQHHHQVLKEDLMKGLEKMVRATKTYRYAPK